MTDEQIISELGFDTASDDVKKVFIDDIRSTVSLRAGSIVEELLTDEQQAEFAKLQEAGDDDAVWTWLRTSVIGVDMSEIYESTLAAYLAELKEQQSAL